MRCSRGVTASRSAPPTPRGISPRRTRRTSKSSNQALGGAGQLFPYDAPKRFLERLLSPSHVLPQYLVDDGLVVAAARALNLLAEPSKNLLIETDSDPRFPPGNRNNGATLGLPEIIFTLHDLPRIASFIVV